SQFHQWRAVGAADRRLLGDGLPRWRATPAPSESTLRSGAGRPRAVCRARAHDPRRRPEAARPHYRRLCSRLCTRALVLRAVPRTRPAARLSLGRSHHGHAAVAAVVPRRPCLHCPCAVAQTVAADLVGRIFYGKPVSIFPENALMTEMTPLETEIRRLIAIAGPMPLAQYMTLCLTHPTHGYYMTRDPLGVSG